MPCRSELNGMSGVGAVDQRGQLRPLKQSLLHQCLASIVVVNKPSALAMAPRIAAVPHAACHSDVTARRATACSFASARSSAARCRLPAADSGRNGSRSKAAGSAADPRSYPSYGRNRTQREQCLLDPHSRWWLHGSRSAALGQKRPNRVRPSLRHCHFILPQ